jgi:hypothetical protein
MPARLHKTAEVNGHYHHVLTSTRDGVGSSSYVSGHLHPVTNGMMEPAADGHNHPILPNVVKNSPPYEEWRKKTKYAKPGEGVDDLHGHQDELVEECVDLYLYTKEFEKDSRKDALESEGFYDGTRQWNEMDKRALQSQGRPALVINELHASTDLVSGYQRQNRTDIKCLPTEEANNVMADINTLLIKNILYTNDFDQEESTVFMDQIIPGRGVFDIGVDYDEDPEGFITVCRFVWEDFTAGDHERYDLSDCEHCHKAKWMSSRMVKAEWPDKQDEINAMMETIEIPERGEKDPANEPIRTVQRLQGKQYLVPSQMMIKARMEDELVDQEAKRIKVIETWMKEYYTRKMAFLSGESFRVEIGGLSEQDQASIAAIPDIEIVESKGVRIRVVTIAGGVLIRDEYPTLPEPTFYSIPVYAHKRGKKWWGLIHQAKDAQRELNKRASQATDIVNAASVYGFYITKEMFPNDAEENAFKENCNRPGFVTEVTDTNHVPIQTQGVPVPAALLTMVDLHKRTIKEMLNIPDLPPDAVSGKQIIEFRRSGQVGADYLFDNLDMAKKRLGRLLLGLIQELYTPERILRIIDSESRKAPVQLGNQKIDGGLTPDLREEVLKILNTQDMAKFDIVVDLSPWAASTRRSNFTQWMQMVQGGMQVPPEFMLKMSDLPSKDEYQAILDKQQQAAQAAAKQAQEAEINKTLVAAQAKNSGLQQPPIQGA